MKKIIEKHPYLTIVFSMILGVLITIVSGLVFFVGILGSY
jgi:carboxyl-terminal processing protease